MIQVNVPNPQLSITAMTIHAMKGIPTAPGRPAWRHFLLDDRTAEPIVSASIDPLFPRPAAPVRPAAQKRQDAVQPFDLMPGADFPF